MQLLRMFFKHKCKVYVHVDEQLLPVMTNGLASYRYQNHSSAPVYTTARSNLTMIPGAEPVDLDESVQEVKPPKPRKVPVTTAPVTPPSDVIPPNTIVVYTDGGASPNPGPAGCGVLLMFGGHTLEIWEYLGKSTNNVAELTAILRALEHIKNKTLPILVYSDSSYAIGVLTGRMKANKNLELIEQVRNEMAKCSCLQLLKVKAHVGIAHNEHVDRLVALARDTRQSGKRRDGAEE